MARTAHGSAPFFVTSLRFPVADQAFPQFLRVLSSRYVRYLQIVAAEAKRAGDFPSRRGVSVFGYERSGDITAVQPARLVSSRSV